MNISRPLHRWISCTLMSAALLLSACLPGEGDVAAKYNKINQDTQIENTGLSLMQGANALSAHLVALGTRRKAPLDREVIVINQTTMPNSVKPTEPRGMKVSPCGEFGAIAYFTAPPPGVGDIKSAGPIMVQALSKRYGGQNVGIMAPGGLSLPAVAATAGCTINPSDIIVGSPIFVAGFDYKTDTLPDTRKATWPVVLRDITIPCPSGLDGVIKREQHCQLISNDNETKLEKAKVKVGGGQPGESQDAGTLNDVARLQRTWRCTPDLNSTPPAPDADEVARFCRDPNAGITKPADNVVQTDAESLKQQIEAYGPGYYEYKCQDGGGGNCIATPWVGPGSPGPDGSGGPTTNPPNVRVWCEPVTTPPLYVANPGIPIALNGSLEIISAGQGGRDCGRGWTGTLYARYLVRRCNMMRSVDGAAEALGPRQSIYHIAYAGAQCERDVNYRAQCPIGDIGNTIPISRHLRMLKPVALDFAPPIAGTVDWGTSDVATSDSRPEIKDMAASQGYVVPNITRGDLNAGNPDNTEWSVRLANAMRMTDPSSIDMPVTACNNAGNPCNVQAAPTGGSTVRILRGPIVQGAFNGGTFVQLPNLQCVGGTGSCHPLLGVTQTSCTGTNARCLAPGSAPDITITGANFSETIDKYLNVVRDKAAAGVTVEIQQVGANVFDNPTELCNLARNPPARNRILVIADVATAGDRAINNFVCGDLGNKTYTSLYDLIYDSLNAYKANGGELSIFTFSGYATAWSSGYVRSLEYSGIEVGGDVSTTLANYMRSASGSTPQPPQDPCGLIN